MLKTMATLFDSSGYKYLREEDKGVFAYNAIAVGRCDEKGGGSKGRISQGPTLSREPEKEICRKKG